MHEYAKTETNGESGATKIALRHSRVQSSNKRISFRKKRSRDSHREVYLQLAHALRKLLIIVSWVDIRICGKQLGILECDFTSHFLPTIRQDVLDKNQVLDSKCRLRRQGVRGVSS
jgi:hypothetical protein